MYFLEDYYDLSNFFSPFFQFVLIYTENYLLFLFSLGFCTIVGLGAIKLFRILEEQAMVLKCSRRRCSPEENKYFQSVTLDHAPANISASENDWKFNSKSRTQREKIISSPCSKEFASHSHVCEHCQCNHLQSCNSSKDVNQNTTYSQERSSEVNFIDPSFSCSGVEGCLDSSGYSSAYSLSQSSNDSSPISSPYTSPSNMKTPINSDTKVPIRKLTSFIDNPIECKEHGEYSKLLSINCYNPLNSFAHSSCQSSCVLPLPTICSSESSCTKCKLGLQFKVQGRKLEHSRYKNSNTDQRIHSCLHHIEDIDTKRLHSNNIVFSERENSFNQICCVTNNCKLIGNTYHDNKCYKYFGVCKNSVSEAEEHCVFSNNIYSFPFCEDVIIANTNTERYECNRYINENESRTIISDMYEKRLNSCIAKRLDNQNGKQVRINQIEDRLQCCKFRLRLRHIRARLIFIYMIKSFQLLRQCLSFSKSKGDKLIKYCAIVLLIFFTTKTLMRNQDWTSKETLWRYV